MDRECLIFSRKDFKKVKEAKALFILTNFAILRENLVQLWK